MGDTKPIGVAYRDQDLDGSTITTPQFVLTALATASTPLTGSELLPVVQSGVTKQLQVDDIFTASHFIAVQDNTTQTNAASTNVITYDTVDFSSGISLVSNSRLTITRAGTYNIQFSCQFSRAGGAGGLSTVELWLAKNNNQVADSNTQLSINNNGGKAIMALNFFVQAAVNDYYELYWYSSDANVQLWHTAAATGPTRPAIPSAIVTISQVA